MSIAHENPAGGAQAIELRLFVQILAQILEVVDPHSSGTGGLAFTIPDFLQCINRFARKSRVPAKAAYGSRYVFHNERGVNVTSAMVRFSIFNGVNAVTVETIHFHPSPEMRLR
jgi:hypothetical protein